MKVLIITLSLIGVVCAQLDCLSNGYSCSTTFAEVGSSLNASKILAFCNGTCPETIRDCAGALGLDDEVDELVQYCQPESCLIRVLRCYNEIQSLESLDFTYLSAVTAVTHFCESECITTTLPECSSHLTSVPGLDTAVDLISQTCDSNSCFRQTIGCLDQFSSLDFNQLSFEDVSGFCNSACVTTILPGCTSHLIAELGLETTINEIENQVCTATDGSCFYLVLECINRFGSLDFDGGLTPAEVSMFCQSDCITTTLPDCTPNFPEDLISLDYVAELVQTTCNATIYGTGGATKPYTLSTLISAMVVGGMVTTLSLL